MCVCGASWVGRDREIAADIDTPRARSQSTDSAMLKTLGFILNALGCPIIYMTPGNSMLLLEGDATSRHELHVQVDSLATTQLQKYLYQPS